MTDNDLRWSEANSRSFIERARCFVPERDAQIDAVCSQLAYLNQPRILELCCGDGLLAQSLLERLPGSAVRGLDGSDEMLKSASMRLEPFGLRFQPGKFDLFAFDWRNSGERYHAIVSSLAIHHLDGPGKARLFQDVFEMLHPGGAFIIADILHPTKPDGMVYAAKIYDATVRRQSLDFTGSLELFEQFDSAEWNFFRYPDDPTDKPSSLFDQIKWLEQAGFEQADVFWMQAGHAVFGGFKP